MSSKDKKTEMIIDGTKYKQIRHDTPNDTNWMNIPQIEEGVIGSGLHIVDKARERTHWDKFNGKTKLDEEPQYLNEPPKINNLKMSDGTIFAAPPHNTILVLRGSDQPEEWVSLEYYQKNKEKYYVKIGNSENPELLGFKNKIEN